MTSGNDFGSYLKNSNPDIPVMLVRTGVAVSLPDITVTDSVPPLNDLDVAFGDVTEMTLLEHTVTLTNDATASLVLGNVASHEIAHLLGLNHTQDPTELLDTTATAGQMLHDQDFHLAPLNEDVFPIGYQDADSLLAETVGRS